MRNIDDQLIKDARGGSRAAFKKLVEVYYEMVYGVAYGILNHHEEAKDAAQETFVKVFQQIKKFEGKSKFSTWLYRIAANTAIDLARKRHPAQSLEAGAENEAGDVSPIEIPDRGKGPREETREAELRMLMQTALSKLSPEHRAVLVLREWQDLSYEEIAESLNVDMGTVMSRLFYAKKKLAQILSVVYKEGM